MIQPRVSSVVTAPPIRLFREVLPQRHRPSPTDGRSFVGEPVPWHALFGNDRPVEVEVGCGRGAFLVAAASEDPDRNFFGLECAARLVCEAQAAIEKAGLTNARVLECDARCVIRHLIGPHTVSAYHLYFPDPWWKRRHYRRRIYMGSFAVDVARTLAPDGRVHVATDVMDLLAAIAKRFSEAGLHATVHARGHLLTGFARRCMGIGRTVHEATFAHD